MQSSTGYHDRVGSCDDADVSRRFISISCHVRRAYPHDENKHIDMLWQSPIVPRFDRSRFIPWSDLLHLSLVSTI